MRKGVSTLCCTLYSMSLKCTNTHTVGFFFFFREKSGPVIVSLFLLVRIISFTAALFSLSFPSEALMNVAEVI